MKKESAEHKAEAQKHRVEAQRLEGLAKAIDAFVSQYETASHNGQIKDMAHLTQPEAVYELLRERGPTRKDKLMTELRQRGVIIKRSSLGVVLSKDERLESDGYGTWKVKQ